MCGPCTLQYYTKSRLFHGELLTVISEAKRRREKGRLRHQLQVERQIVPKTTLRFDLSYSENEKDDR